MTSVLKEPTPRQAPPLARTALRIKERCLKEVHPLQIASAYQVSPQPVMIAPFVPLVPTALIMIVYLSRALKIATVQRILPSFSSVIRIVTQTVLQGPPMLANASVTQDLSTY